MEIFLLAIIIALVVTSPTWFPQYLVARRVKAGDAMVNECGPFTYKFKMIGINQEKQLLVIYDFKKKILEKIHFNDIKSYRYEKTTQGARNVMSQFYFTVTNHPNTSYSTYIESPHDEELRSCLEIALGKGQD